MTNEFGHLASIAAVGVAAGFFIMGVHRAAPSQPVVPVAAVPTAPPERLPYEEGSARLVTQSVLGGSSSAIDPASYGPAPEPEAGVEGVAAPVPGPSDEPMRPAGVGEGAPRAWRGEPGRTIEGARPLVEQRVETSMQVFVERERIRRPLFPERIVQPIERPEERRVFAGGRAEPVLGQAARRSVASGGFGGGHGAPAGARR